MKPIHNFLVNNHVLPVDEHMKTCQQYEVPQDAEIACFQYTDDNQCTVSFYSSDDFMDLVPFAKDAVSELKGLGSSVSMNDCTIVALA